MILNFIPMVSGGVAAECDYPDPDDVRDDVVYADGELEGELVVGTPTTARGILNAILVFIGTERLTDDEWSSLSIDEDSTAQDSYAALLGVLESRDAVSTLTDQLSYYFQAKGLALSVVEPTPDLSSDFIVGHVLDEADSVGDGESNIFVGGALED